MRRFFERVSPCVKLQALLEKRVPLFFSDFDANEDVGSYFISRCFINNV